MPHVRVRILPKSEKSNRILQAMCFHISFQLFTIRAFAYNPKAVVKPFVQKLLVGSQESQMVFGNVKTPNRTDNRAEAPGQIQGLLRLAENSSTVQYIVMNNAFQPLAEGVMERCLHVLGNTYDLIIFPVPAFDFGKVRRVFSGLPQITVNPGNLSGSLVG